MVTSACDSELLFLFISGPDKGYHEPFQSNVQYWSHGGYKLEKFLSLSMPHSRRATIHALLAYNQEISSPKKALAHELGITPNHQKKKAMFTKAKLDQSKSSILSPPFNSV